MGDAEERTHCYAALIERSLTASAVAGLGAEGNRKAVIEAHRIDRPRLRLIYVVIFIIRITRFVGRGTHGRRDHHAAGELAIRRSAADRGADVLPDQLQFRFEKVLGASYDCDTPPGLATVRPGEAVAGEAVSYGLGGSCC